ncbi:MAG: DUF1573 domain-containing protein [Phycisphaerales bacterium]|nr:MAG: DUF1573 domain-containing protein [Phycisphaerales bacterium]
MSRKCTNDPSTERDKQGSRRLALYLLLGGLVLLLQSGCREQAVTTAPTTIEQVPEEEAPEPAEVVAGQEPETAPPPPPVAQTEVKQRAPKITFEEVVHDFGEVGPDTKSNAEFRFTNTGDGPLKITEVEKCCGVSTRLAKRDYAPGEGGVLHISYSSTSRPGVIRRQLHVNSTDKANPRVALTIKAKIVPKVGYEPKRLKLFLSDQDANYPPITLTSLDGKPFSVTGFQSTANCITADFDPSVEATEFVLQPKTNREKLQENLKGRISISLSHPQCKTISILFDVLPRFTTSPSVLIVLNAEPEKPVTRKVWVLNNYEEAFEIESASSKENTLKVLNRKSIRNGYEFEVEITPPARQDKRTLFTDVFLVDVKDGENLAISCRGFYSAN